MEGESAVGGAARKVGVDDDHRRGLLGSPVGSPCGRVQHRQGPRPGTVARPAAELRPDPRPRSERCREVAPLAACLGDVQHPVHHGAQVVGVLATALPRRVEHRLQQVPLVVGQVTWVRHAPHGDDRLRPCNRDTPSNSGMSSGTSGTERPLRVSTTSSLPLLRVRLRLQRSPRRVGRHRPDTGCSGAGAGPVLSCRPEPRPAVHAEARPLRMQAVRAERASRACVPRAQATLVL